MNTANIASSVDASFVIVIVLGATTLATTRARKLYDRLQAKPDSYEMNLRDGIRADSERWVPGKNRLDRKGVWSYRLCPEPIGQQGPDNCRRRRGHSGGISCRNKDQEYADQR